MLEYHPIRTKMEQLTKALSSPTALVAEKISGAPDLIGTQVYEGMLAPGYEGMRENSKRLRNTMSWPATAGDVDNFVCEDAIDAFIKDPEVQKRLPNTNPNALRDMAATLLEANGRGYWDTAEGNII